ncbi:lysophospholipid acyltransferase family protein [Massilia sp. Root335]|uniref:lysophospholipid acyltransferase family protein n=1 Tax=Massilia sp. Root335 TaxID=1736517 RepID=UPI0006FB584B|nr:lysophospholipid acyltransferase family protein [Massilia sp. Root335]KQV42829.1 lipid A biosynthesis acyltransferase [Massilia sp. Root335]
MRFLIFLLWLLHFLPLPVLGRIGNTIGWLMYYAIPKRRKIALINLRLCMPERSEAERVDIAKRHFMAYSRSILERSLIWWAPLERVHGLIDVVPAVPKAQLETEPVILFCPHFVCLDVAGVASRVVPLSSMYAPQKNKAFDDLLRYGRERYGPVRLFTRSDGIKPIIRALREKMPYFMLPDMDFGEKDAAFVPFFGVPAATLTALGRLAGATGAKVIPVVATFLPNYKGYRVEFYPAWDDFPGDDIIAATRRMNAFIEDRVREHPAEYFWTHKRFKTRPPGEPSFYD